MAFFSFYVILYLKLRDYNDKLFNYSRMSIISFNDLLDIIENDLRADETTIGYCISPEKKLIVTLR